MQNSATSPTRMMYSTKPAPRVSRTSFCRSRILFMVISCRSGSRMVLVKRLSLVRVVLHGARSDREQSEHHDEPSECDDNYVFDVDRAPLIARERRARVLHPAL